MEAQNPTDTLEQAYKQPATEVRELKKHFAVDFLSTRKLVPIRRCKVTAKLIESCKPGVATWRGVSIRYYLADDADVCKKLAPYIDSRLT
jgi:hypothetical protein